VPDELPLGPGEVLLVTGGGKGITAECALALARDSGASLALLGRTQAEADTELAANLARLAALGIPFRYVAVDITDAPAVRAAVGDIEASLGPIAGVLHGAARNTPQLLNDLDERAFQRTLAPKITGLRNLLAAIPADRLRLLVTFGSIIARTGLPGEADYGLANEWLTRMTEQFQAEHPACRCLAVEWSVWADVGMGARLGLIESLTQQGITPIPPDQGVEMLRRLLARRLPRAAVVVTGRYGALPTLKPEQAELPFLRFLERQRVFYPGVELIVEAELSSDTDPYLADHVFCGEQLFPAVMGLEAMAQAVVALGGTGSWSFEEVRFARPVVVPPHGSETLRLAALLRAPGLVEVVLRSSATAFQVDHFWARSRLVPADELSRQAVPMNDALPQVGLDPDRDLYGGLFFHRGRFQRLRRYRRLTATGCIAEIGDTPGDWFGHYMPPALLLGDPGARDAAIHAIQACVPHLTLLPVGVARLVITEPDLPGPWLAYARERRRDGETFIYDVEVRAMSGALREYWEGLHLRVISGAACDPWFAPLLGPYVERRFQELAPGTALTVAVEQTMIGRPGRSDHVIQRALGTAAAIRRRVDGKPEVDGPHAVSVSHAGELTLAVAGPPSLGCDIELVTERAPAVWQGLLGSERLALVQLIAREMDEDLAIAATRVWAAGECLKKAGAFTDAPLVLAGTDDWVLLGSGHLVIGTFVTTVRGMVQPVVFALAALGSATLALQGAGADYQHCEVR
jgi:enediyne polyketide synthase